MERSWTRGVERGCSATRILIFQIFFFRILRVSRVTRAGIALMADELEREWLRDHGEAGRDQGGAAVILLLHCFVDTAR